MNSPLCVYRHTHFYWDLKDRVLCTGGPALRKNFAGCFQIWRGRCAAIQTKEKKIQGPLQSSGHFAKYTIFHLGTTNTWIMNYPWCSCYTLLKLIALFLLKRFLLKLLQNTKYLWIKAWQRLTIRFSSVTEDLKKAWLPKLENPQAGKTSPCCRDRKSYAKT